MNKEIKAEISEILEVYFLDFKDMIYFSYINSKITNPKEDAILKLLCEIAKHLREEHQELFVDNVDAYWGHIINKLKALKNNENGPFSSN